MLWFTSQRMQKLCLTVRLKGGLLTILIFSYFGEARIFQTEARQKHNTVNYSTIMVPATDCCWIFLNNPFFLGVDIIAPSLHGTQEHLWRTLGWELIIVQQLWTTNYKMIHTSHQKWGMHWKSVFCGGIFQQLEELQPQKKKAPAEMKTLKRLIEFPHVDVRM